MCGTEVDTPTLKPQLLARWWMLALLCTGLLGSYYCYDNPSATITAMQTAFGGNSTSADDDSGGSDTFSEDFNLLYSVYSWPKCV